MLSETKSRLNGTILKHTLFFFLLVTQICFAQWVQHGLDDKAIWDIAARNSNIFAVTTDSALYRSTDNGITWSQIIDSCATDIAAAPSGLWFLIREYYSQQWDEPYDSLYKSSDNGNTWVNLNIMEQLPSQWLGLANVTVSPVGFVFCGLLWYEDVGNMGTHFAISMDDGLTWTVPMWPSGEHLLGGDIFDFRGQSVITSGYATFGSGMHINDAWIEVYLSSDNGQNWSFLGFPPVLIHNVLSMCFNGNLVMGSSLWWETGIFLSSDSCGSWIQVSTITPNCGLSIESGGTLVGNDSLGIFLFSDNGDSLGSRNEGLTNLNIHTLSIDNNNYVYAGTENGIWRRPLSEMTSVEEEQIDEIPTEFLLTQNYPNPFNPTTSIQYAVSSRQFISLKVYDVLGNEIETLINEEKPAGTYEVTWYAENLPSGVYFYQLKAGSFVETQKMLLLK